MVVTGENWNEMKWHEALHFTTYHDVMDTEKTGLAWPGWYVDVGVWCILLLIGLDWARQSFFYFWCDLTYNNNNNTTNKRCFHSHLLCSQNTISCLSLLAVGDTPIETWSKLISSSLSSDDGLIRSFNDCATTSLSLSAYSGGDGDGVNLCTA